MNLVFNLKKNILRITSLALTVVISLILLSYTVSADAYSDYKDNLSEKDKLIAENEKLEEKIDGINAQIDGMYGELKQNISASDDLILKEQSYAGLLTACLQQLSSERELLSVTEELISTIDNEVISLEDRQVYLEESLIKTVRSLHENDGLGYIEFLLGSTDIIDFLNRFEYVTTILEYHDTLLDEVEKTESELMAKREECVELKARQEESLALLEIRRVKYDEIISECIIELEKIDSNSKIIEELIKLKESDIAAVEKELEEIGDSITVIDKEISEFEYTHWFWPGDNSYITSYFGGRDLEGSYNNHKGIDINLRYEDVYAARAGTVTTAKYSTSYGYYIVISHGNGVQTLYAHLSKIVVKVGQVVRAREKIAVSGNTGWSTGPHLHFEIILNGTKVNPLSSKSLGITGKSSYLNVP